MSKIVEARMKCTTNQAIPTQGTDEYRKIQLMALYESGGNESWSKWTPQGQVDMVITNPGAFEQFEVGETYKITFEKVSK